MQDSRTEAARDLMVRFAERTGLASSRPQRRYLWTDAFAVCNFLALAQATGDAGNGALARLLVDRVHHVLGRHRADDSRRGWISGLSEAEGELHPTSGGLRIGKELPERGPAAPFDERLEWQRDGQYFHYLTKWMHALDQTSRATGEPSFASWACELALRAQRAFVVAPTPGGPKRMYWKCSIDLSRPQVPSMGQHDPLDGFLTCVQLAGAGGARLRAAAADFASMLDLRSLATSDPLGLGGLLCDAYRVHQLAGQGALGGDEDLLEDLLESLLAAAASGLRVFAGEPQLRLPATHRLAFRELGLAIGLAAASRLTEATGGGAPCSAAARASLARLEPYLPLGAAIEAFWLAPEHRDTTPWHEHADINDVMLATRLVPAGFLELSRRPA